MPAAMRRINAAFWMATGDEKRVRLTDPTLLLSRKVRVVPDDLSGTRRNVFPFPRARGYTSGSWNRPVEHVSQSRRQASLRLCRLTSSGAALPGQ